MMSHPKDSVILLDSTLINIQYYKIRIKGKVDESREWCSPPRPTPRIRSDWKGSFGVTILIFLYLLAEQKLYYLEHQEKIYSYIDRDVEQVETSKS